jgi:hypothetical protein
MPSLAAESASDLLDLAASEPDVELKASQPALSLAVQVSGLSPVFCKVTDALVPLTPKSTCSGATSKWAGWLVAGTVMDTETVSEPAPRAPVTWTAVVYVPGAMLPRCAETDTDRLAPANIVPELAPRDSHSALSLALHSIARVPALVSVNDELDPSAPKSMLVGDTSSLPGFAASDSTSVGADEVHAAIATAQRTASVAGRTRTYMDCTASLQRGMCCRVGPGDVPGSAYWKTERCNEHTVFEKGASGGKNDEKRNSASTRTVVRYHQRDFRSKAVLRIATVPAERVYWVEWVTLLATSASGAAPTSSL